MVLTLPAVLTPAVDHTRALTREYRDVFLQLAALIDATGTDPALVAQVAALTSAVNSSITGDNGVTVTGSLASGTLQIHGPGALDTVPRKVTVGVTVIPTDTSLYVSGWFEIAAGSLLEVQGDGIMEIG